MREEFGWSKTPVLARMKEYDLLAEADAIRVEAHMRGPRTRLPQGRDREKRRAKLVAVLESCDWNLRRARRQEGISMWALYRMMHDLGVERPAPSRNRLAELV